MTHDATALHEELTAAGLRINGCSSDGRIDWAVEPTRTERLTAEAVLRAHDPTRRERDEQDAKSLRRAIADRLAAHTADAATWRDLSAADRLEDMRLGLRLISMLARRMV